MSDHILSKPYPAILKGNTEHHDGSSASTSHTTHHNTQVSSNHKSISLQCKFVITYPKF